MCGWRADDVWMTWEWDFRWDFTGGWHMSSRCHPHVIRTLAWVAQFHGVLHLVSSACHLHIIRRHTCCLHVIHMSSAHTCHPHAICMSSTHFPELPNFMQYYAWCHLHIICRHTCHLHVICTSSADTYIICTVLMDPNCISCAKDTSYWCHCGSWCGSWCGPA